MTITPRARRRRRFLGAGVLVVIALVAWPLLTYVGIPEDHYASAPDPCRLVSERTVHAVTAQARTPRTRDSDDLTGGSALGLTHRTRQRTCDYSGPGHFDGPVGASSVRVWVDWYTSTQFGLGPSGAERAERHLDRSLDAHEIAWDTCSYERRQVGNVCGFHYNRFGANVLIQRENVYISVTITSIPGSSPFELPDGWLDQRIAEAAEDVLTALDSAP